MFQDGSRWFLDGCLASSKMPNSFPPVSRYLRLRPLPISPFLLFDAPRVFPQNLENYPQLLWKWWLPPRICADSNGSMPYTFMSFFLSYAGAIMQHVLITRAMRGQAHAMAGLATAQLYKLDCQEDAIALDCWALGFSPGLCCEVDESLAGKRWELLTQWRLIRLR